MATRPPFTTIAQAPVGVAITPLGSAVIPGATVSGVGKYTPLVSLVQPAILGFTDDVQCVWVDASTAVDPVTVRNVQTRQYQTWPPGTFGWQQLLAKKDAIAFELYCFSAATIVVCVANVAFPSFLYDAGVVKSSPYVSVSRVAAVAADTALLAENPARQGFGVENDSTATLKLLLGAGAASSTNFTKTIQPGAYFETPFKCGAAARGIWSAVNGAAQITEYF